MNYQHLGGLVFAVFLGWTAASAGCITDLDTSPTPGEPGTDEPGTDPGIQISPDTCTAISTFDRTPVTRLCVHMKCEGTSSTRI